MIFNKIVSKLDRKEKTEYNLNFDKPLAVEPASEDNKLAKIYKIK